MPVVLVTGASRGLGFEFVRQYAADGWDVIACCRKPEAAKELRALAAKQKTVRVEALEVTDQNSIGALAQKLKNVPLDLLINNAGIFSGTGRDGRDFQDDADDKSQSFGTIESAAWARVLETNAIAPIMVTEALTGNLLLGKGRKAVMITSKMGSIELAGEGDIAYRSSKAALNAAMHNIALSLKDRNVTVAALHPGWVKTDMGGSRALLAPEESITGMRQVIAGLTPDKTGQFFDYSGKALPW